MRGLKPCPTCGKEVALSAPTCIHCGERLKKSWGKWIAVAFLIPIALAIFFSPSNSPDSGATDPTSASHIPTTTEALDSATPEDISPAGEIATTFAWGGDHTDLQRENMEKKITGRIVQWTLPVYEVKRSGEHYRIQTSGNTALVGIFANVYARNTQEVALIEGIKTGDEVTIKGKITGTSLRNIELSPAVLVFGQTAEPIQTTPAPVSSTSEEQKAAPPPAADPPPAKTTPEAWQADWGNNILATLISKPCEDAEFSQQGFQFYAASSIPLERLKTHPIPHNFARCGKVLNF